MGTRKITRKEMKQDEFVSSVSRITLWMEEHLDKILWGAAAVVVVGLLSFWFASWRSNKALQAQAALASVVETYGAEVGPTASSPGAVAFLTEEDKFRTVIAQADSVVAEHGSTDAGQIARVYRGLAHFELGEDEEARADFEGFLSKNGSHYLAPQVRRKLAQACSEFRDLSERPTPVLPAELSLLDLAGCLAAKGDRDGSIATYQRILDEFPQSIYVSEARSSLEKLQAG